MHENLLLAMGIGAELIFTDISFETFGALRNGFCASVFGADRDRETVPAPWTCYRRCCIHFIILFLAE
jgi:hypothetical protein